MSEQHETKTMPCKHGTFTFFADDRHIGRSMDVYGEWSEDEVEMAKKVLTPDDVVVEVGANIGAHTVPIARLCKYVYAFEPNPETYELLCRNLEANGVENVCAVQMAVGDRCGAVNLTAPEDDVRGSTNFGGVAVTDEDTGTLVEMTTLDAFIPRDVKVKLIKGDCEGSELAMLKGAREIIARDRPLLYVENDKPPKSKDLIAHVLDIGYRAFWHHPPLFYPENFRKHPTNVWPIYYISINMICVPVEKGWQVGRLEEVEDLRRDPDMHRRWRDRMLEVLKHNPADLDAKLNAAHFTNLEGDGPGARRLIAEMLEAQPGHVGARTLRGLLDLQAGNYVDGWPAYELRYEHHGPIGHRFGFRDDPKPKWDGRPTDATILLTSEQGFGDSIMFARFVRDVRERCPRADVKLMVQPQLYELFEFSGLVEPGNLYRQHRTLPEYDVHLPLPSLPAVLGLTSEDQLTRGAYLDVDPAMVEVWRQRGQPKVGICLRGGTASERAYSRDMPEELWKDFTERYGIFLSLENHGQWESFADTAAAVKSLGLVVTVDTSVAHLAGALGVPTWLMLSFDPDWRWGLGRADTPWYPSMRIFRQRKFMDWTPVIDEITALADRAQREIDRRKHDPAEVERYLREAAE